MDLSALAAKQKRVRDWQEFAERGLVDEPLRSETIALVKELQEILAACWQAGAVSAEAERRIIDVERRLEQANEESRLTASSHTVITKRDTAGGNGQRGSH